MTFTFGKLLRQLNLYQETEMLWHQTVHHGSPLSLLVVFLHLLVNNQPLQNKQNYL